MDEEEATYRITPLGLFSADMELDQAKALESLIIDYLNRTGYNAIILEDGHLNFESVQKEWD